MAQASSYPVTMTTPWCGSRRTGHSSRSRSKYWYGSALKASLRKKSTASNSVIHTPARRLEGGTDAAVDKDVDPVDEARLTREQERNDRGDLLGPTHSVQGRLLHEP